MYSKFSREILSNHGEIKKLCLNELLNKNIDFNKPEYSIPLAKNSNYHTYDQFIEALRKNQNCFSLLCLNINTLMNSK